MWRYLILCLIPLIQACSEAEASRIRSRARRALQVKAAGSAAAEPADSLVAPWSDWLLAADAVNFEEGNWTDPDYCTDLTMTKLSGTEIVSGVSTTGLTTSGGIGSARENKALTFAQDTQYGDTGLNCGISATDNANHMYRMLWKPSTVVNGEIIVDFIGDATSSRMLLAQFSSNRVSNYWRLGSTTSLLDPQNVSEFTDDEWHLVDSVLHDDDDTTPYSVKYINGTYIIGGTGGGVDYTGFDNNAGAGSSKFEIGDTNLNGGIQGEVLFYGFREGGLGLHKHRAHAEAMGLYSPSTNNLMDRFDINSWLVTFDGDTFHNTRENWVDGVGNLVRATHEGASCAASPTNGNATTGLRNIGTLGTNAVTFTSTCAHSSGASSGFPSVDDGVNLHTRILFKRGSTWTNNNYFYRYSYSGTGANTTGMVVSGSNKLRYASARGGSNQLCDTDNIDDICPTGVWCLVDIFEEDTGATTAEIDIFINGEQRGDCSLSGSTRGALPGNGTFFTAGYDTSNSFDLDDETVVFIGMRENSGDYTAIGETEHQADVLAMIDNLKRYTDWVVLYEGQNEGATWADSSGNSRDLANDGTRGAADQSTTGLSDYGLGGDKVDEAVDLSVDTNYCDTSPTSFPAIADNQDIHVRLLFYRDGLAVNDFFINYEQGGDDEIEVIGLDANRLQFTYTAGSTTKYIAASPSVFGSAGWYLVDINMIVSEDDTTPYAEWFINGTKTTAANGTINYGALTGTGHIALGARAGSCDLGPDVDLVMGGIREGAITEAEHDADVNALGL